MIEIVTIGEEILAGMTLNTNTAFISRMLVQAGWEVARQTTLPDRPRELKKGLQEALERSSVVIATGGLGPTCDDVTRHVAAELFGSNFIFDPQIAADLERRYGTALTSLKDQATRPEKATALLNKVGTAPGLIFQQADKVLILMPGVPQEMEVMCREQVIPLLLKMLPEKERWYSETFSFFILRESEIDPLLRKLQEAHPKVAIGIYPAHGTLTVCFKARRKEEILPLKEALLGQFRDYYYSSASGKIEEALYDVCKKNKVTFAAAESCTGGMIAEKITALPGASDFFLGSIVAYSNPLKRTLLSVSEATLEKMGAVSAETVSEMLLGLFKATGADFGVAVSGIAGPTGGSPEKPVGTIWAAAGKKGEKPDIFTFHAKGNRQTVILTTTHRLLAEAYKCILKSK